jgi:hypothetical protein
MFVLEGTLITHQGSVESRNFVGFPDGMTMEHDATQQEGANGLFITNKKFEILAPGVPRAFTPCRPFDMVIRWLLES